MPHYCRLVALKRIGVFERIGQGMLNRVGLRFLNFLLVFSIILITFTACGDNTTTVPATTTGVASNTPTPTTSVTTAASSTPTVAPTTTGAVSSPKGAANNTPTTIAATPTTGQVRLNLTPARIRKANGEMVNMSIEVARTDEEQGTGLMGRASLPADSGMLFVFKSTGRVSFWMKDTPLPLSIAFIAADGKIVDIQDMQPFSEQSVIPRQDHLYALEVTQGYFNQKGIKLGDVFTLEN